LSTVGDRCQPNPERHRTVIGYRTNRFSSIVAPALADNDI
jgi:hypothetical protein